MRGSEKLRGRGKEGNRERGQEGEREVVSRGGEGGSEQRISRSLAQYIECVLCV